jgi:hypothetical protein
MFRSPCGLFGEFGLYRTITGAAFGQKRPVRGIRGIGRQVGSTVMGKKG